MLRMNLREAVDPELRKEIKAKIGAMDTDHISGLIDYIPTIHYNELGLEGEEHDIEFEYEDVEDRLREEERLENVYLEYVLTQLLSEKVFEEAYNYAIGDKWAAPLDDINDIADGMVSYFSLDNAFFQSDDFKTYVSETLAPEMEDLMEEWESEDIMQNQRDE